MRFLWRELPVKVRLIVILLFPSVYHAGLSRADCNRSSLPSLSVLTLSRCPAALTSLTALQKELMNSGSLSFFQSGLSSFGTLIMWQIWLELHAPSSLGSYLPHLQPSTLMSLLPYKWTCRTCDLLLVLHMQHQKPLPKKLGHLPQ